MNWKTFFLRFLRNVVLGILFGVVALGAFGYFLAGKEGMINMAYWGVALGLIGGFWAGLGVLFEAKVWGTARISRCSRNGTGSSRNRTIPGTKIDSCRGMGNNFLDSPISE